MDCFMNYGTVFLCKLLSNCLEVHSHWSTIGWGTVTLLNACVCRPLSAYARSGGKWTPPNFYLDRRLYDYITACRITCATGHVTLYCMNAVNGHRHRKSRLSTSYRHVLPSSQAAVWTPMPLHRRRRNAKPCMSANATTGRKSTGRASTCLHYFSTQPTRGRTCAPRTGTVPSFFSIDDELFSVSTSAQGTWTSGVVSVVDTASQLAACCHHRTCCLLSWTASHAARRHP